MTRAKITAKGPKYLTAIVYDGTLGRQITNKKFKEKLEDDLYILSLPPKGYSPEDIKVSTSKVMAIACAYIASQERINEIFLDSFRKANGRSIPCFFIFKDMIATEIGTIVEGNDKEETRKKVLKESQQIPDPSFIKKLNARYPFTRTIAVNQDDPIMQSVLEEMLDTKDIEVKTASEFMPYLIGCKESYKEILLIGGNPEARNQAVLNGIWVPEDAQSFQLRGPKLNYSTYDTAYESFKRIIEMPEEERYEYAHIITM